MTQAGNPAWSGPGPATGTGTASALIEARMDRIPVTSRHRRIARVIGIGTFFDAFDGLVLASALTVISKSLGDGFLGTGVLISAGYAGQAVGALGLGSVADRLGRRRTFLVAIVFFSIMSLACAFAWNLESLTIARLIQGIGLGAEVPLAATLINEYAPSRDRGRAVMLYEAIFAWGAFAAPLLGLIVFHVMDPGVGWRVLLGVGVLPAVVVLLGRKLIPESVRYLTGRGHTRQAEAIVSEFEVAAVAEGKALSDPRVSGPDRLRTTRLAEIFSPQYRTRTILNGTLWFTTYFAAYGYTTFLPSLYVKIGGLAVTSALYLTLAVAAGQVIVIYAFALTTDRWGRRPWFLWGYAAAVLGAVLGIVMVLGGATSWPTLFVSGLFIAIGSYVPAAGLYLYIPELYPTRVRGWGTSAGSAMCRVASVVAPLVVGSMLSSHVGLEAVFSLFGAMVLIGGLAMFFLGAETKGKPLEEISDVGA